MRISDWSSDVCSSDLTGDGPPDQRRDGRCALWCREAGSPAPARAARACAWPHPGSVSMRAAASPLHCVTSTCRHGDMAERRGQSVCQLLRIVFGPEVHEEQTRLVVEQVIVQRSEEHTYELPPFMTI